MPLPPAIPFHLLRMGLAVLFPVPGMRLAPLARTLQADLAVNRVRSDLLPVIIPPSLTLAWGLTANPLLGMIRGRLKDLLAITATATTHRATPDQNVIRSFCPEASFSPKAPTKKSAYIESLVEFFTASSRMGLLLIKPAELLLFYSGADTAIRVESIATCPIRPRPASRLTFPTCVNRSWIALGWRRRKAFSVQWLG